MSFEILMGNNEPTTTNSVFGMNENYKPFNLDLNVCSQSEKDICDNFFSTVGLHASINIINSPYNFIDINYVSSINLDNDFVDVDYDSLSNDDKITIDEFANLINNI